MRWNLTIVLDEGGGTFFVEGLGFGINEIEPRYVSLVDERSGTLMGLGFWEQ